MTGFANSEEEAVGLTEGVPFLLEERLRESGGLCSKGAEWAPYVQVDDDSAGLAAAFDPRPDVECYIQLARDKRVSITHVFQVTAGCFGGIAPRAIFRTSVTQKNNLAYS